jgi:ABC-2 type transport system permease protein
MMRKILQVALRDYKAAVKTKGFIIGLVLAPIIFSGGAIGIVLLKDQVDTTDKRLAVLDHTGKIAIAIADAAEERNDKEVYNTVTGEKIKPAYIIEIIEANNSNLVEQRLKLSDRVRQKQLRAFLEIHPAVVHPADDREAAKITYHSESAALDELRRWVVWPINQQLRRLRLADAGITQDEVKDLFSWISVEGMGLVSMDIETGELKDARKSNEAAAFVVPMVMLFLMFLLMMMGAVPLLSAVMEEKTMRIAEVMLGSVKPFQFMMGKILAGVAVSLTGSTVYIIGGIFVITKMGLAEFIPYHIIPWFLVFLLLNILMIGSIMAGLGSTCNDAKDAQSLSFPAMLPLLIPMFVLVPVIKEPLSSFSTWLSLFPPFTPLLMILRQSTPGGIPGWQPWVGLFAVILFTLFAVWAGGRIFRVGILMQGQPPKLANMVRWAIRG